MNKKIKRYLDEIFKPYEDSNTIKELKEELLANMQEKYNDLLKEVLNEDSAFQKTIDSLGDISEIIESISDKAKELHQKVNEPTILKSWNLSYSNILKRYRWVLKYY